MAEFNRKAGVVWNGDLKNGNGLISTESKVLFESPFTFHTRFGDQPGTNPEELIAAAHAACFSMALASTLAKNGHSPRKTDTNATCILSSQDGGYKITKMTLHVRVEASGLQDAEFQRLVKEADKGCPVSNLLRSGLEIQIDATLDYT